MARWATTEETTAATSVLCVKIESSRQLDEVYQFGESIGEGAFGSVRLAVRKSDKQKFAVKKMIKKKDPKTQYGKSWENEIHVLRRFHHQNLVEVCAIYESENSCYLFMELCDAGSLADELTRRVKFTEQDAKCTLRQLGNVLYYLHRHRVVHRDLKPQNCLLKRPVATAKPCLGKQFNSGGGGGGSGGSGSKLSPVAAHPCPFIVKLTDFGLSIELRDSEQSLGDNVGTPAYQAPEIVSSSSYTEKCDVWSFGLIMYYLLHGNLPYARRSEAELAEEIKAFDYGRACANCRTCAGLTSDCRRALSHLLVRSPIERWSSSEFMASAWVTEQAGGGRESIFDMMRNMNKARDN